MTDYTVQAGDTLVRIAQQFGFPDWRTIYNAPENSAFRARRPDPDKIFPGDQLIIPDRDPPSTGFATGQRHRFRLSHVEAPPPTASLTVHVVDDRAQPIDGADVSLAAAGADTALPATARTTAGTAAFTPLAPGRYTVGVRRRGYRDTEATAEVTAADEVTLTLTLAWTADWDRAPGPATMHDARRMLVTAPGLPAGTPVTFKLTQGGTALGQVDATSDVDRAEASWDSWFKLECVPAPVHLQAGEAFPAVQLAFTAELDGVTVPGADVLGYADRLDARIDAAHLISPDHPADYILYSPYGTRRGTASADGVLAETELPPGGVSVVFVDQVLTAQ